MEPDARVFTPEAIAAVVKHMNDDHAEDSVLICRALGGQPDASAAVMRSMDADGIEFAVEVGDDAVTVRVPWGVPITERGQVRLEVVRMCHDACAALGIEPRAVAEH
jgi:putative heme iron utilization protein